MAQSTSELAPRDEDSGDDFHETAFFRRGCCSFFNFPCFKSDKWERISTSGGEQQESLNRSWWDKGVDTLKKVREWSELVAGPKWKTFIRRFNKSAGRARPGKFGYDPLSYALNFDNGQGQNGQYEIDQVYREFSTRYAAIPVQNAQSKDATLFT
ncbi:hypothetical protein CDL12_21099 [Handroanthus impetiginosus]|uniref:Uncharacterized protein n=1 Tax=Handroanthus impetiginosus TaxID=429701 RepID=A0A2G9GMW2_9LAMI|nr:hypothetical protein CDL12_21099 [Handroanthus impetiginosus]